MIFFFAVHLMIFFIGCKIAVWRKLAVEKLIRFSPVGKGYCFILQRLLLTLNYIVHFLVFLFKTSTHILCWIVYKLFFIERENQHYQQCASRVCLGSVSHFASIWIVFGRFFFIHFSSALLCFFFPKSLTPLRTEPSSNKKMARISNKLPAVRLK